MCAACESCATACCASAYCATRLLTDPILSCGARAHSSEFVLDMMTSLTLMLFGRATQCRGSSKQPLQPTTS
jgi:hypothetical protein